MAKKKKKKGSRRGQRSSAGNPSRSTAATERAEAAVSGAPTPTEPRPVTQSGVQLQPFGEGPRFSVLMAAYNRADLIHVAIDSVLVQDFEDYELVIVDDGSTDRTPEVVRSYDDPRIRYIRKDVNEGRSPTRNRAIAEARGEFVLWMADDDLIAPGVLRLYDGILRENPEVDVVYGNLQLFDHDTGRDLNVFTPNDWTGRRHAVVGSKLYGSCVPDGGTATRRKIYGVVGDGPYDPEFVRAQDYELWTRIVGQANFYKVDDVVYRYRKHDGGTSWGEFIDLTLDSKIIRRHLQRHPLRALFLKLDWRDPETAQGLAFLRIAKNLRIYGDHENALRFLDAIPGSQADPRMIDEQVRSLIALGELQEAEAILEALPRRLARRFAFIEPLWRFLREVRDLKDEAVTALKAGQYDDLIRRVAAIVEEFEPTYDTMYVRAQAHQGAGDLESAMHCFCLAARLQPADTKAAAALVPLVERFGASPKTDLSAMRRRLQERFVELPEDETPHLKEGPLVSVIVTAQGDDAVEVIENLDAQTYPDFEILVADSGNVSGQNVRTFEADSADMIHERGLRAARGKYIAWVESGDRWYPDHLSRCVGTLEAGAEVVVTQGHLLRVADEVVNECLTIPPRLLRREGNLAAPILPLTFLVHRSTAADWRTMSEARWDYLLQLLSHDECVVLHHPGGSTLEHQDASDGDLEPDFERAKDLGSIYGQYTRETLFDRETREAQNSRLMPLGLYQVEQGRTPIIISGGTSQDEISACLQALDEATWVAHDYIVLAEVQSEAFAEYLNALSSERDDLRVHQCSSDVSPSKLINDGLSKANGAFVVLCDIQTRPTPGWLGRLQWCAQEHDGIGAFLPRPLNSPISAEDAKAHRVAHWGQSRPLSEIDERCVLLTRAALERVGGMDVALDPRGYEWPDFTYRMRSAGFGVLQIEDVAAHLGARTVSTDAQGLARLVKRWGFSPEELRDAPPAEYDRDLHYRTPGAEEGYRPDTRPVAVVERKERNLLLVPPVDDDRAMQDLLRSLTVLPKTLAVWLRVPPGSGAVAAKRVSDHLRALKLAEGDLPDLLIIDAHLAPEREGGLYVGADAVLVEESWPNADESIRRAADCGRLVLRDASELTRWAELR